MIVITEAKDLKEIASQDAYTITGVGGDINEWIKGYTNWLEEEGIGTPKNWYSFSGELYNTVYDLTGDNRYPNDLIFLSFSLDGLNIGKLAIFKLRQQDRWLSDIVDNDLRRESDKV